MAFTVNDVSVVFEPEKDEYRKAFGDLVCELDAMQERLERSLKKSRRRGEKANRKAYDVSRCADSAMRESVDRLLGQGVSSAIYGDNLLFATSSQKSPLWFELVDGLYSSMDAAERPSVCEAVVMKYRTKRIARKKIS